MRILVLGGVGAMGLETTKDLVSKSDFSEIVIGDIAVDRAKEVVSKLGDERLSVVRVDASNVNKLASAMKGFDVVACALPFKYDLNVTKACIKAGTNGIDLSAEENQFALDEEAKKIGITYIAGCGATPGTTNLMAKYGISKLDRAEEVQIAFAAFRSTAIAPGLLRTTFWEFDPAIEERVYYKNGEFIKVNPFEGAQIVEFHEQIGRQEVVYIPHPETQTLPKMFPDLQKVEVKGCFPPATMELVKLMVKYNFYQTQPIEVNGKKVKPVDFMYNFLYQTPEAKKNPVWAYGLIVTVVGQKNGKPAKITLKNNHPSMSEWDGKSAYGKNVGIPLSIGAQLIAKGKTENKGVLSPEAGLDHLDFFKELSKRGIQIHEKMESYID
ncbi:MAG: saccharopine dehydrogenase NADP-binding domain-containing protein [Candidatus Bathyarchaeota archaeon]|nr:MAG: saccharopine dehydrogenase NADP-binding domain-containing protein [Candidatus Bathyarchaeota archaeon]